MKRNNMENNSEDFHKEIEGIKKENPFSVPENYFDNFSARLAERIEEESTDDIEVEPEKNTRTLWSQVKPFVAFAAVFCGFALMIYGPIKMIVQNEELIAQASTSEDESIDDYILSESNYYTDSGFIEMLTESNKETEDATHETIEEVLVAELSAYEIAAYEYYN